jgi:hypothetical protein
MPQIEPTTSEHSTAGTATDIVVPAAAISRAATGRPRESLPST